MGILQEPSHRAMSSSLSLAEPADFLLTPPTHERHQNHLLTELLVSVTVKMYS